MADIVTRNRGMGLSKGRASTPLKSRFVMPPFSVISTRDAAWIERRRAWVQAAGIKSEIGRKCVTYATEKIQAYKNKTDPDKLHDTNAVMPAASVFDPVLCELAYRWWCPTGGVVVDPFAGGSVRGLMASMLGRRYWGCELRAEQVAANEEQASNLHPDLRGPRPRWVVGDCRQEMHRAPLADFLLTCPPYGSLEVYSKDPSDLSNMPFADFATAYTDAVAAASARMKDDTFAVWVVGNYREGHTMRDLVGLTTAAHEAAGLALYNEAVLLNCVGTGALRVNTSFVRGRRKLVKMHQNILVYVKGCPLRAAEKIQENEE